MSIFHYAIEQQKTMKKQQLQITLKYTYTCTFVCRNTYGITSDKHVYFLFPHRRTATNHYKSIPFFLNVYSFHSYPLP